MGKDIEEKRIPAPMLTNFVILIILFSAIFFLQRLGPKLLAYKIAAMQNPAARIILKNDIVERALTAKPVEPVAPVQPAKPIAEVVPPAKEIEIEKPRTIIPKLKIVARTLPPRNIALPKELAGSLGSISVNFAGNIPVEALDNETARLKYLAQNRSPGTKLESAEASKITSDFIPFEKAK